MCGINGIINNRFNYIKFKKYIKEMNKKINHRGPDENDFFIFNNGAISNTRLSIIDLKNGSQPMYNENKSISVVQNGEIYNYLEVKNNLLNSGIKFKTESDTEVVLKAYEFYGEEFVNKLNGMFAISIIDMNKNLLLLYRDRLGVKPLYYYYDNDNFSFSSEIKSFFILPFFNPVIRNQAIHNYFTFNYIPIPETIFENVFHLEPGNYLKLNLQDLTFNIHEYWNILNQKNENYLYNEADLIEKLNDILIDSVKIRLRSDVPIAAFLSGGLDSSIVCSITKNIFNQDIDTYTIGFNEKRFDESSYASQLADFLKLKNNQEIVSESSIKNWQKIIWFCDQPHGDISFLPTFHLSNLTAKKNNYKVVLTGDGGDEVFGGYTKYLKLQNFKANSIDYFKEITLFKKECFSSLYSKDFLNKIDLKQPFNFYKSFIKEIQNDDEINKGLYFDIKQLLPGNNLVKPDKMAMANSLETRSPLLDFRLFETMINVSGKHKIHNNITKYIFKKLSLKYLPEDLVYRKKQMFTVPIGEWFKGQLMPFLHQILQSNSFKGRNLYNLNYIDALMKKHTRNEANYTRELRAIVALELWFRAFID
jgi:asparagine synthase (glutamine-hydrolysing)